MTIETATFNDALPLQSLHESKWNPRKTFHAATLAELTESVKAKGVMTPFLVRPHAKGYEIGAGHRRFRAATAAGLATVPALIRNMSDEDFLQLVVFENDEREDVHPLEEAAGYRTLMAELKWDVGRIAQRTGKSEKYVYDRVKLLALIPEVQTLFIEHAITAGHAILLARLKPEDQKRAIHPDKGGLFEHEQLLLPPDTPGRHDGEKARSVRELEGWINKHVRFQRAEVDAFLFPETAAAMTSAVEQDEKIIPITYDYHVQDEAKTDKERTYGPMSWKRADGKKSKTCGCSIIGVIVAGPGRGEAFKVCINKDKCVTHWGAEKRERAKRAKRGEVGGSQKGQQQRWRREQEQRDRERQTQQAAAARWKKALPKILGAIATAVKKASPKATGLLASIVIEAVGDHHWTTQHAAGYVGRGTSAEDALRHAAFIVLGGEADEYHAPASFPKRAKAFGVDVQKLLDAEAPVEKGEKKGAGEKK